MQMATETRCVRQVCAVPAGPGPSRGVAVSRVIFLLCLVLLVAATGCAPVGPANSQFPNSDWFETDVLLGVAEDGQPVATITISAPFRKLIFYRAADGFRAPYRLRAILRNAGLPSQMHEWSGDAWAEDYEGTRGNLVLQRTETMELDAQSARTSGAVLEVQILMDGSDRKGIAQVPIEIGRFREGGLVLGELALYRLRDRNEVVPTEVQVLDAALPDPDRFVRRNSASFDFATAEPWVLMRVFDLRPERADDQLQLRILTFAEGSDESTWQRDLSVTRAGYETSVFLSLPVESLHFGANRVEVRMEGATGVAALVENLGLDLTDGPSWKANLRQVQVLASEDEFKELEEAAATDRRAKWDAFWARRDPDPSTPQNERLQLHYDRVAYARAFLRDGFADGALSDRGKVWLLYGRPDSIDNSSPGFENYGNYEVWRYRGPGIAYYFRDVDGLGRFRLVWQEGI